MRRACSLRQAGSGSEGHYDRGYVERMDAGESVTDLAEDYDLSTEEIMEAVLYERAA
jgi:hypothetical protein